MDLLATEKGLAESASHSVVLRLTDTEHAALKALSFETGTPMTILLRRTLNESGLPIQTGWAKATQKALSPQPSETAKETKASEAPSLDERVLDAYQRLQTRLTLLEMEIALGRAQKKAAKKVKKRKSA
jgi:hypothetical protein